MSKQKLLECQSVYDEKTKIWSGLKKEIPYNNKLSIGQVMLESLKKQPDHINQICYHNGKHYTNLEIATLTIRIAQHFQKLNITQGEIIGLCASNSDYVAPLAYAAWTIGITLSTLDPSFDLAGIKHIYAITRPKLMFCDGGIYDKVKQAFEECNIDTEIFTLKDHVSGVRKISEFLQETGTEAKFCPPVLKDGLMQHAIILCSSGTTGLPKGVCISHAGLLQYTFGLKPGTIYLCFSTLYWISGLFSTILVSIEGGTRIITDRGFSIEYFFDIVQKYKVDSVLSPPSQLGLILASPSIQNQNLNSIKEYMCAGSPIPFYMVVELKKLLPHVDLVAGYGMSEVFGVAAWGKVDQQDCNGKLVPNLKAKVLSETGEFLGPNELGEICMQTAYAWRGYYKNPENTARIYDAQGWIHSGDLGYFNDEGTLFIIDRKKDIIKYRNFHVTPSEIEQVILQLPQVAEVCVFGIPDDVSSHLPACAIVKKPASILSEKQVVDYVAENMAHFKQLRGGVFIMDSIPKTASGKTQRHKVLEICAKLAKNKM